MNVLLGLFKRSEQPRQAADDRFPSSPAGQRMKEQLASKTRHPSVIPGSFFERDTKFKQHTPFDNAVVPPRSEGPCEYRQSKWSGWTKAWCKLQGSHLLVFNGFNGAPSSKEQPTKKLPLVGSRLEAGRAEEEFTLSGGDGAPGVTVKVPSANQREEWMVALSKVPGLFRRVEDYYEVGKIWGHGATSEVHECIGRFTGRRLAIKRRRHSTREATQAMHNELRILQMCSKHPHPAIPLLEDFFFDTSGRIELVLELLEGGDLFDWISGRDRLTETEARMVFSQIASGVAHLHSLGIAHRDLKPQNLMYAKPCDNILEQGVVQIAIKIIDYDLARVNYSPQWEGSTPCGTVHYMAPEIVKRERYSLAVDCWSLGVILYILLSGKMPFRGRDDAAIEAAIESGNYSLQGDCWDQVTNPAKDLVRKLLSVDPEKRLTAEESLRHPWLTHTMRIGEEERGESDDHLALPTVDNLRKLSTNEHSSGVLRRLGGKVANVLIGSAGLPESLGKTLDYDMSPLRRQASGATELLAKTESTDQLANLRVTLELVGTHAGIKDSRRSLDGGGSSALAAPRSPTADNAVAIDHFADLDAAFVEEEDQHHPRQEERTY